MLTVTKKFSFCYGHRLPEYKGKCVNYHGHNSEVEVEVGGEDEDSYPTMVIDFSKLKAIVNALLVELDHNDLTSFFDYPEDEADPQCNMVKVPPTAETICRWLRRQIECQLPKGCILVRLRVSETPDSWAEWKFLDDYIVRSIQYRRF